MLFWAKFKVGLNASYREVKHQAFIKLCLEN